MACSAMLHSEITVQEPQTHVAYISCTMRGVQVLKKEEDMQENKTKETQQYKEKEDERPDRDDSVRAEMDNGTLLNNDERAMEEQHLAECLAVVRANIDKYQVEESVLGGSIKDMFAHYHDDNPEMYIELANSITRKDSVSKALRKNLKALVKPYFGRIDYDDIELGRKSTLYLGKNSVAKNSITMEVVDWRAPIASVYYENEIGHCTYQVPDGSRIPIELERKRTYEIDNGKLADFYDSEVVANDELLTKYLAKNKEAVLGEIIATIQKEQNDIIRRTPYRSVIVQGVAGSGKTTVAMHRISYILYNFPERFRPSQFYIIGSNRMFLNYITSVLPDLDVENVNQMTMEQFLIHMLQDEAWIDKCKPAKPLTGEAASAWAEFKGSWNWMEELETFIAEHERKELVRPDVCFEDYVLSSEEATLELLERNRNWSLQEKRDHLNARVMSRLKSQLAMDDRGYEKKQILEIYKQYNGIYGPKKWKGNLLTLYVEFLSWLAERKTEFSEICYANCAQVQKKQLELYDYATLLHLKRRVKETEAIDYAEHVVVDEAQDYGAMVFGVIKTALPRCTFTIMGDVSQNINYESGMNDWETLKEKVFNAEGDYFGVLAKSYRNTIEISDYAGSILAQCSFPTYKTQPIIRHGEPVKFLSVAKIQQRDNEEDTAQKQMKKDQGCISTKMIQLAANEIKSWQSKGYDTIAVICKDEVQTDAVREALRQFIEVNSESLETTEFTRGVMVLPIHMTKGLEFDTVLLMDPSKEAYPKNDANAKLLYVAATRALHELTIVYNESLSELL